MQQFSEVAVLLIIIVALTAVGAASARRVSSALLNMNDEHGAAGRQLRRQIVGTTAFVFVTFLLRAVFSIMNAASNVLQNLGSDCDLLNLCSPSCFNMWDLMQFWLEFVLTVLISSPLALLVALWGMTSKRALRLMTTDRRQMVWPAWCGKVQSHKALELHAANATGRLGACSALVRRTNKQKCTRKFLRASHLIITHCAP